MDMKDLRIDSFSNSSPIINMRITHIPTGLNVKGDNQLCLSQHRLKERLLKELEDKLSNKK